MTERGIARHGYPVFARRTSTVGDVTSRHATRRSSRRASASPTCRRDAPPPGTELAVEIRGKRIGAGSVKTPFYKRPR